MAEVVTTMDDEQPKPPHMLEDVLWMMAGSPEHQAREASAGTPGLLEAALNQIEDEKKRGQYNG